MLDRALARTFGSFSTLLLLALVITVPVHLAHSLAFKNVLAVRGLSEDIATFPEGRQVRGVDRAAMAAERNWLLIAVAAEVLVLLPLGTRAARRVYEVEDQGGVSGVLDAYGNLTPGPSPSLAAVALGAAIGAVAGWLLLRLSTLLADMAAADRAWAIVGIGRAASVALAVAITFGVAAASGFTRAPARRPENIDLY